MVEIIGVDRRFLLRHPIDLDVRQEAGRWIIEYPPLELSAWDRTEDRAYAAFAELFDVLWEHFVAAPDRELGGETRDLKRALKDLVKDVKYANR